MEESLIIFVKNLEIGHAKTRIAATIGEEATLRVYKVLLEKTKSIIESLPCKKYVFYADSIGENDLWSDGNFEKRLQVEGNLGKKMKAAFTEVLAEGAKKVIIIGSDCYDLTTKIVESAFASLNFNDAVIGPAQDGGYYLLGLKEMIDTVFDVDEWSSPTLCNSTFYILKDSFKEVVMLPTLSDVDEEKDISFTY
jgi:hypothetical protein